LYYCILFKRAVLLLGRREWYAQQALLETGMMKLTIIGCPEWKHWTSFWLFNYVIYFFGAV
jgi:hypothetical protein